MGYFWNNILLQAIELVRSVVYLVWIYSVLWGFQVVRLQGKEAKMLDRLAGYEFQLVPVHFRGRSFSYSSGLLIFRFLIFEFHRFEWKFFRFWSRLIILNKDFNDPTDHWQNGLNFNSNSTRFHQNYLFSIKNIKLTYPIWVRSPFGSKHFFHIGKRSIQSYMD